ncbi:MAG: hypothetical protein J7501_08445 [Bdellovibrio sp.]|nr:hypothetical protein [Bdellovibrio sp.]
MRSEPLIRPTVISEDQRNIAAHTVLRLFPDLQMNHYILWGVLPEAPDTQLMMTHFVEVYYKTFHTPAHVIQDGLKATPEEIKNCEKPCWILLPTELAHELTPNEFIQKNIQPLGRPFFSISYMPFTGNETVTEACNAEQRLTYECVTPIAVREVSKKLKDPQAKYFFMRKYNERDFFLFVQKP